MAARQGTNPQHVPPGSTLIVIHDFVARSPDELSLSKGDRIELIERDDDFGDGWFLGKHLTNGNTGLFPEVYTRPAPKGMNVAEPPTVSKVDGIQNVSGIDDMAGPGAQQGAVENTRSLASESMRPSSMAPSHNPVMNETLDVIKEHINDLNTPRQSINRGPSHDSGSIYAQSQSGNRASYIRGHETDEEESPLHTEKEVLTWTPQRVAEYLEDKGVERQHCDVFKEQEISGEVLLNMEQSSIFIKEFDLGSVGRRLKTWQKVRALQDEVRASSVGGVPRSVSNYSMGGDDSVEGALVDPARQRSLSTTSSNFLSPNMQQGQKMQGGAIRSSTIPFPQVNSPQIGSPLTGRPDVGGPRPSAHNIRTMQHSRRHSSLGSDASMQRVMLPPGAQQATGSAGKVSHERTRSSSGFDPSQAKRASRFGHGYSLSSSSQVSQAPQDWGLGPMGSPQADLLDRGYFSGNEVDKRNNRRSVLQKKSISASHSRNPSENTDNMRMSYQSQPKMDSPLSPTVNNTGIFSKMKGHRSASSPKTFGKTFPRGVPTSPVVTRLDYDQRSPAFQGSEASSAGQSPSTSTFNFFGKPKVTGLRVASDSVAASEKSNNTSKPSPLNSPTRTGSTSPSIETRSIDHAKSDPSRLSTGSSQGLQPVTVLPAPRTRPRARSKKFTSAYTRGLEKKAPRDQMQGSDYSGWMKKKSASLVGSWKPRLFVLRGRRLSYYYSENDTEEKGLIDISGHRVLPAENDRITGLHATLTGAKSPQTPDSALTTSAAADLAAGKGGEDGDEGLFIFKLVPPRQGMSKAVNFTKPVVHYFAVGSRQEGRLWMAALMKATIDYDASGKVTTSYNQPTISLKKARERRERPPALREAEAERERMDSVADKEEGKGLGIGGLEGGQVEDEDEGSARKEEEEEEQEEEGEQAIGT
ncbi:hypothetical protein CAC42_8141 [Sphaceloma murrayae]|uniref:Protein BOI2 n=1 Tax=Sphaceloma murrayae TaxID=2082308 RepID=A0A2K1QJS1_9PEZI|nr:hypothetical protein CAC42_8141 [Sphaceloma murrayae]